MKKDGQEKVARPYKKTQQRRKIKLNTKEKKLISEGVSNFDGILVAIAKVEKIRFMKNKFKIDTLDAFYEK